MYSRCTKLANAAITPTAVFDLCTGPTGSGSKYLEKIRSPLDRAMPFSQRPNPGKRNFTVCERGRCTTVSKQDKT